MPTLNDYFPSKYLSAGDLKKRPVVVTIARVESGELTGDNGITQTKPVLAFERASKELILNKTNFTAIADFLGPDTDDWIGGKIELYPDSTDMRGKRVACVRARKPGSARTAAPPPKQPLVDEMSDDIPW